MFACFDIATGVVRGRHYLFRGYHLPGNSFEGVSNHVFRNRQALIAVADVKYAARSPARQKMERERLQGQVVNSPQRIRREMADQKQALEQVFTRNRINTLTSDG